MTGNQFFGGFMQVMATLCHHILVWPNQNKKPNKEQKGGNKTHTRPYTQVREATQLHAETRDPPSQDPRDHMAQAEWHNDSPLITSKQTTTTPRRNESGEKKGETKSETLWCRKNSKAVKTSLWMPTGVLWSAPVAFRRVALETPEWTSRDSNHHRQSVSAGKTNATPTEPSGRLLWMPTGGCVLSSIWDDAQRSPIKVNVTEDSTYLTLNQSTRKEPAKQIDIMTALLRFLLEVAGACASLAAASVSTT